MLLHLYAQPAFHFLVCRLLKYPSVPSLYFTLLPFHILSCSSRLFMLINKWTGKIKCDETIAEQVVYAPTHQKKNTPSPVPMSFGTWAHSSCCCCCVCVCVCVCMYVCVCWKGEREAEERERHIYWLPLACTPTDQEPNSQPRRMPWLGLKPATFCFAGWCPTNWATPVKAK